MFWDQVTAAFDRLDNKVTPEDRHRFEAAIAARVPRPTAKDYKALERERREREAWMEEALRCAAEYRLMSSAPFLHTHCAFCGGTDMVKGDTGAMIIAKAVAERKAKA